MKFAAVTELDEHVVSRPVWGAWIEIQMARRKVLKPLVAPRMGRVD